jgi:hypothetical protein
MRLQAMAAAVVEAGDHAVRIRRSHWSWSCNQGSNGPNRDVKFSDKVLVITDTQVKP